MLALTEEAVEAIRNIVEESEVGPNGGLRISGLNEGNGGGALEFELAPEPVEGDAVVRERGAVVFLDQTAADVVADKRLDVHAHGDHFHFTLDALDD